MSKNVLDQTYIEWSTNQKLAKLPDHPDIFHQLQKQARIEQQQQNDSARFNRLYNEQQAAKEKEATRQAKIDQELAGEKTRIKNEWLAAHPAESASTFETKA